MKYYVDEEKIKDELYCVRIIAAAPTKEMKDFFVRFSNALRKRGVPVEPVINAFVEASREEMQ